MTFKEKLTQTANKFNADKKDKQDADFMILMSILEAKAANGDYSHAWTSEIELTNNQIDNIKELGLSYKEYSGGLKLITWHG